MPTPYTVTNMILLVSRLEAKTEATLIIDPNAIQHHTDDHLVKYSLRGKNMAAIINYRHI